MTWWLLNLFVGSHSILTVLKVLPPSDTGWFQALFNDVESCVDVDTDIGSDGTCCIGVADEGTDALGGLYPLELKEETRTEYVDPASRVSEKLPVIGFREPMTYDSVSPLTIALSGAAPLVKSLSHSIKYLVIGTPPSPPYTSVSVRGASHETSNSESERTLKATEYGAPGLPFVGYTALELAGTP